jgi:hypothetical protein
VNSSPDCCGFSRGRRGRGCGRAGVAARGGRAPRGRRRAARGAVGKVCRVFEKVAAVDVAKASGMVCTPVPHPSRAGARRSTVWEVAAAMPAVRQLAAQLLGAGSG